ncbi:hypothetical protein Tco_0343378 [Tanacetum coccineum]
MSNTNNNLQTQTSNALHNAIMEAGGKDRPPMLAPGNYNPLYKFKWTEKNVPVTEDNDIYSIVDACPNACKMWKAIEKLKQDQLVYHPQNHPNHYTQNSSSRSQQDATRNKGKAIVNSSPPTYDQDPDMVTEDDALSKEREIDKFMALISLSFKKIYKPTNNNLRTSSNTTRECQKLKRAKDAAYHKEKMLLCKQKEAGFQLNTEQIQEVTLDVSDNSRPIFDTEPLQKVQNNDDNYNVFANDREHPVQPESVNDIYLEEQRDTNITIEPLDMSTNRETVDQDDDDLAKERDFLASLIEKLKCKIDDSKNRYKLLESSNNDF